MSMFRIRGLLLVSAVAFCGVSRGQESFQNLRTGSLTRSAAWLTSAGTVPRRQCLSEGSGWHEVSYILSHPEAPSAISDYECGTYRLSVASVNGHEVTITVSIPSQLPEFPDAYPPREFPEDISAYLTPTPRIQSEDPVVAQLAKRILKSVDQPCKQENVVAAVLRWTDTNMCHALPNEVPDAVTCIKRGSGNCIGFTHVAAALLRNLGIPARTVRTLYACPACGKGPALAGFATEAYGSEGEYRIQHSGFNSGTTHMLRHSVVEVYYPESRKWAMYEPQTASVPGLENIRLAAHADWDVETQQKANAISKSKQTHLTICHTPAGIRPGGSQAPPSH